MADAVMAKVAKELRPAFGSGEDWNDFFQSADTAELRLRPAFGSGEDWNRWDDLIDMTRD